MPLYLNDEQAITFLHIPKTAGTTIETWLNETGKFQQFFFSQQKLEGMLVTPQHLGYNTLSQLTKPLARPFEYKFAIVRNPFDRIVSEFFYRINLGSIQLGIKAENFFASWLIHNLNKYKKQPDILDNHLRPQNYFIKEDVEVFKFEDGIQTVMKTVSERLSLPNPAHVKPKKVGIKEDVKWTASAIEIFLELYGQDFEKFGYSKDTSQLKIESSKYNILKSDLAFYSKLAKKKLDRKLK